MGYPPHEVPTSQPNSPGNQAGRLWRGLHRGRFAPGQQVSLLVDKKVKAADAAKFAQKAVDDLLAIPDSATN